LTIGNDVYVSLNSTIIAHDSITIGDDTTIGWDTLLMDTDFHRVVSVETGNEYPMTRPIEIGKHCWICNGAHIMKGSIILDDVIVASKSLVNKKMDIPSCSMIAGVPAELKKKNIKHIR
jgi:acetyltransferase-like isoleucine patch superfamily enzyme